MTGMALEERYRAAAELLGGFAYGYGLRDGKVTGFRVIGAPECCGPPPRFPESVHPEDAGALEAHLAVLSAGNADERELRFVDDDCGGCRWLRMRSRPYPDAASPGSVRVFGIAEDESRGVAERRGLALHAEERERELSSLLEITHNMASTLELEPLLGLILTELKKLVDYTGAAILKPDGDDLIMLDYRGPMPRDQAMRLRIPIVRSMSYAKIISERVPVIIPDVLAENVGESNFQRSIQQFRPFFGYAYSVLLAPLIVKDRLIGILRLDHRERGHFIERHATLALAVANQAAVAMENAQLYEQAQQLAKLEERQRIARELHDSVSQSLYGIRLGAQSAIELQRKDAQKTADALLYVRDLADAGLMEMRALIYELRPEAIASEGLVSGLHKMTASIQTRYGISVRLELCEEPDIDVECKDALYRIAQEAVHNVVKHAKAKTVLIRLAVADASVSMEVCDDGKGFSPSQTAPGRLGLVSMVERAYKLGGVVDIETAPGEGTRIRTILPMRR